MHYDADTLTYNYYIQDPESKQAASLFIAAQGPVLYYL